MIMRKVIRRGSFTSVADLRSKLLNFIAYFNRVFAKPFQLDVHRSSAAGQAGGVKRGKGPRMGMSSGSWTLN